MYLYDEIDQKIVDQRVEQFRGQTRRFLEGKLSEDEFYSDAFTPSVDPKPVTSG